MVIRVLGSIGAVALFALVLWSCGTMPPGTRAGAPPAVPPLALSEDLPAAIAASGVDGERVLVLVREDGDSTGIDAAHWLSEDDAIRPVIAGAHVVAASSRDGMIRKLGLRGSGLAVLTAEPALISAGSIPARRAEFAGAIARLLATPAAAPGASPAVPGAAPTSVEPPATPDDEAYRATVQKMKTLVGLFKDSDQDPTTFAKARPLLAELLATPMSPEHLQECAGNLASVAIEMDDAAARTALLERLASEAPRGRFTADVCLDLADDAFADGEPAAAARCWELAERAAGDGESPSLASAARAARALALAPSTPARAAWERRQVLDVVVLVPDLPTFVAAISRWSDRAFFPVLFQDDIYAPKFIAAFAPKRVLTLPSVVASGGEGGVADAAGAVDPVVDIARLRAAILDSWSDAKAKRGAPTASDDQLRARLAKLALAPDGVVLADPGSGELAGGIALAAGRFQGFEFLASPETGADHHRATPADQITSAQAWALAKDVEDALARWPKPDDGAWRSVTLAGAFPFRRQGLDNWGDTYALDDLLGRSADGVRHAVVGRLLGDASRSAYQAACSLFLQPDSALLFDTYDRNPRSTFGHYRLDPLKAAWPPRLRCDHVSGPAADVAAFRARCLPWNLHPALIITSSGGADYWNAPGGGGTTDDFPVGVPTVIHVTHSGSAMNPYDIDTLAGRAIAGGAFVYFGSVNEPFLNAFQSARYAARRIASGAPFAAVYRTRTGQWGSGPWRLMAIGDPQCCLRRTPIARVASIDPSDLPRMVDGAREVSLDSGGATMPALLRRARWLGDHGAARSQIATITDASTLDQATLAMALEECLQADACARAMELFAGAGEEARGGTWARIYARMAVGRLMDQACAADDLERLLARLGNLLTTKPAGNYVERWMDTADALARRRASSDTFQSWLEQVRDDASMKDFSGAIRGRIANIAVRRLSALPEWAETDKAAALATIADLGQSGIPADQLSQRIDELMLACVGKLPGATVETFLADVHGLASVDDAVSKRLGDALALIQARRQLFKDWLILGPFANAAHGAWEELEASAGKVDPAATWTEGESTLAWKRPFIAESFGTVDLAALMAPNTNVHGYALARVVADQDAKGYLLLGSDDGVRVWLDGKQIWLNPSFRAVTVDQDKVPIEFTAGAHQLLVRVDQGGGGWGFCARLAADADGKQPLAGVRLASAATPAVPAPSTVPTVPTEEAVPAPDAGAEPAPATPDAAKPTDAGAPP